VKSVAVVVEQRTDGADRLVEASPSLVKRDSNCGAIALRGTRADAGHEPPAGQGVDRGEHLGSLYRAADNW
jgi:hypothetical protein